MSLAFFIYSCFFAHTLAIVEEATPGQFPYVVSLKLNGLGGHNCAGAILSPWWIISTGNCAQLDDDLDHDHFVVVAGEWDLDKVDGSEQKIHVETVFTHPYFSSAEQTSDIALIRLNESLVFNENVSAIDLAEFGASFTFMECVESGWSKQASHKKLSFSVAYVDEEETCRANPNNGPMGFGTMCAADPSGNAAMCPGYTGSPLVCPDETGNWVLAGLQSYTWSCLTPGAASVYTNIGALKDWVDYILSKYDD